MVIDFVVVVELVVLDNFELATVIFGIVIVLFALKFLEEVEVDFIVMIEDAV